jgi:hypothetical protein
MLRMVLYGEAYCSDCDKPLMLRILSKHLCCTDTCNTHMHPMMLLAAPQSQRSMLV